MATSQAQRISTTSADATRPENPAEAVLQMLMEADVEGLIGAGRHERTGASG